MYEVENEKVVYASEVIDNINWFYPDRRAYKGIMCMPPQAYQLLINGLELIKWEAHGDDKGTIKSAIGILEVLRDKEKFYSKYDEKDGELIG